MNLVAPQNEHIEWQLPLKKPRSLLRWTAFVLGVFFSLFGLATLWMPNGNLLSLILIGGFGGALLYASRKATFVYTNSSNACVINCLAPCLEFSGRSWSVTELEEQLRLNQDHVGINSVLIERFLVRNGIQHQVLRCESHAEFHQTLAAFKTPLLSIIRYPVLCHHWLLRTYFSPWQSFKYWLGKPSTFDAAHAVVIYGSVGDDVLMYDPLLSTKHRVSWNWLRSTLMAECFSNGSFLMIMDQSQPPRTGGSSTFWVTTTY